MIIKVIGYSVASAAALFILTKIMGEKQISQMSLFDYIIGITIGSIAAEMATNLDRSMLRGIVAMAVYAVMAVLFSFAAQKSLRMRRFLTGTPVILMRNGQIIRDSFKKSHFDLNEFLMCARLAGYYNINEIDTAIMESNGAVSFMPVEKNRPLTPQDMNLSPQQQSIAVPVVTDGVINMPALRAAGRSTDWLLSMLKAQGYKTPGEVFLAVCDKNASLTVYAM